MGLESKDAKFTLVPQKYFASTIFRVVLAWHEDLRVMGIGCVLCQHGFSLEIKRAGFVNGLSSVWPSAIYILVFYGAGR